jgi:hybrid cluster-associated redox disulfide protein
MDPRTLTLDWTIEQMLSDHPAAIPVLLEYRLACVGCLMAPFCTLEEAAQAYHLGREQLLDDLRRVVSAPAISDGGKAES